MLRLVDITAQDASRVILETEELVAEDIIAYVMYDTSTGITDLEDYYTWRATSVETSSGEYSLEINDANKYPKISSSISDYVVLDGHLFKVMSLTEYEIIQMLLTRIDMIRKRFPNPGVTITDVDSVGQDGSTVSFSGGWDKKFSLEELRQMIEGTLIECNAHPPHTSFYWQYSTTTTDVYSNPYTRTSANATGVPYELVDLIVQGAVIRCLVAWGILEIDINFSTSDAGLTITYERVGHIASWMDRLLNEFKVQKDFIKMHYVNSYGIGVGTMPFGATALWGMMLNQVTGPTGITPLSSMLGFGIRSNVPL